MGGAATAVRTVLCARVGQEARLFLVGWIEFIVFNLERCESFETIQAVLMRTVEGYQPDSTTRAAGHASPVSLALPSRTLH